MTQTFLHRWRGVVICHDQCLVFPRSELATTLETAETFILRRADKILQTEQNRRLDAKNLTFVLQIAD